MIDGLSRAVLDGEPLEARGLAPAIMVVRAPSSIPGPDPPLGARVAIMAAALAERLASYGRVDAPSWTQRRGAMPWLVDLLPATGERLRKLLAEEAPEVLRRRNVVAPRGLLHTVWRSNRRQGGG